MEIAPGHRRITIFDGFSGNNDLRNFLFPSRYDSFFQILSGTSANRSYNGGGEEKSDTAPAHNAILSLLTGLADL